MTINNDAALIDRMRKYCDTLAPPMARGLIAEAIRALKSRQPAAATERCSLCDNTGDINDQTGEWRGECPHCEPAAATGQDPVATLRDALTVCLAELESLNKGIGWRDGEWHAVTVAKAALATPTPVGDRALQRIELLRKSLFEARDAMRIMSNWVKKSDPAGFIWAAHMVDRANAALNSEDTPAPAGDGAKIDETLNARIREIFLANGFTVKDGQTDLKPYVYKAAYALLWATGYLDPYQSQPAESNGIERESLTSDDAIKFSCSKVSQPAESKRVMTREEIGALEKACGLLYGLGKYDEAQVIHTMIARAASDKGGNDAE
jgi:hypothetical protein